MAWINNQIDPKFQNPYWWRKNIQKGDIVTYLRVHQNYLDESLFENFDGGNCVSFTYPAIVFLSRIAEVIAVKRNGSIVYIQPGWKAVLIDDEFGKRFVFEKDSAPRNSGDE